MKELIGTARNIQITIDKDRATIACEIILMVSEPQYKIIDKKIEQVRPLETIRFCVTEESLNEFIVSLINMSKDISGFKESMDYLNGKIKMVSERVEPKNECK